MAENEIPAASIELPRYKSHKTVWALKIKEIKLHMAPSVNIDSGATEGEVQVGATIVPEDGRYAPFTVDADYVRKHEPKAGGYYVVYPPDGYKSWSPVQAFEEGYTRVQDSGYPAISPFRVEADEGHKGCEECGSGQHFNIVGLDGVAESTSYDDKEHAEDIADMLTDAFNCGVQWINRRAETAERELQLIDEALARRPALDKYTNRYSKVCAACETAGKAELEKTETQFALERDRSVVADYVTKITKAVQSRDWLMEGRGPYEWNDDNWHKEFAAAAKEILDAVEPLAKIAADWSNCPKTAEGVRAAREPKITGPLLENKSTSGWPITCNTPKELDEAYRNLVVSLIPPGNYTIGQEVTLNVAPKTDPVPFNEYLLPADRPVVDGLESKELVYAEHQPEYIPLRTLRGNTDEVPVLSRWTLTPEQRQAVAAGADVFLKLLTFRDKDGHPNLLQPIQIMVSHGLNKDGIAEEFRLGIVEEIENRAKEESRKLADTLADAMKQSGGSGKAQ